MLVFAVGPHRLAFDGDFFDLFDRVENGDIPETFHFEFFKGAFNLAELACEGGFGQVSVSAGLVAFETDGTGGIKNDGGWDDVVFFRQFHKGLAVFGLEVGGVDDSQFPQFEAGGGQVFEYVEGLVTDGLVIGVVGNKGAEMIAGKDFSGFEVFQCKSAFA